MRSQSALFWLHFPDVTCLVVFKLGPGGNRQWWLESSHGFDRLRCLNDVGFDWVIADTVMYGDEQGQSELKYSWTWFSLPIIQSNVLESLSGIFTYCTDRNMSRWLPVSRWYATEVQDHPQRHSEILPIIRYLLGSSRWDYWALFQLLDVSLELPLIIIDGVETPRNSLLARILNNKPVIEKWTQSRPLISSTP